MGNYEQLKEAIRNVIKQNGRQEITGQILQSTLLSIVSNVGENASFAGVAIPSTVPATSDKNIFYIAGKKGTYANFGGKVVSSEAVIFTNRSGAWTSINTGLATLDGVTTSIQSEHAFIEEELDRLDMKLTELKQTDITDMKGDIELNSSEIQKAKNDITKINGEIATLNEAANTAADELVRIEGKVDNNKKEAVLVFVPSSNTGIFKDADILGFTNETAASMVNTYMQQYWNKLVAIASGKVAGRVYAEADDANCTGMSCIGGKKFAYTEINVLSYEKGVGLSATDETLKISFERSGTYTEMTFSQKSGRISVARLDCANLLRMASDMYDIYNMKESATIATNEYTISSDSFFKSYIINVDNIEEIKLRYYIHGNARCAMLDNDFKIVALLDFKQLEIVDVNVNINEYKKAKFILYCTRKTDLDKSAIYIKKTKMCAINDIGMFGNAISDVSSCNLIDGYRYGGNLEKIVDDASNAIYFNVLFVKAVLVLTGKEENDVAVLRIKKNGNYVAESAHTNKDSGTYKLFTIFPDDKYIAVNNKKAVNMVPRAYIIPTYNVYNELGELLGKIGNKSSLLYNYGDGISYDANGSNIYINDDFYPVNEQEVYERGVKYTGAPYYVARRNKLNWADYAFDFATLTDCKTKNNPKLQCILAEDAIISMSDKKPNYILIWYGINDVTYGPIMQRELWLKDKYKAEIAYPVQESEIGKEGYATAEQKAEVDKVVGRVGEVDYDNADSYFFAKFVGTENDEVLTTWCGALNYAFPLLMSEYPEAKIMIICPDHEKHGKLIREATIKMAEKWGVLYFDLNSLPYWYGSEKTKFENTQHEEMSWPLASGETAAPTVEGFNKSRYSYDGVKPSELGHKVISFPIGNKLING